MPFSTMGTHASWTDVAEIRRNLFDPVAAKLSARTGRPTELVIEDEKKTSGPIHHSMFAEALDAEVYIADLTGNNPNVFLELGVRWASRDHVTVLVTQDRTEAPRFNVGANRIVHYGPKPTELREAVEKIVSMVAFGLDNPDHTDSPVLDGRDMIIVTRHEYDDLHAEIDRLKEQQAEDFIHRAQNFPAEAVALLEQAIRNNPVSAKAHFALGMEIRKTATTAIDYARADEAFRTAVSIREDFAQAWRELGTTQSKASELGTTQRKAELLADAERSFRRAVEIDPEDYSTWSTLAGLLRRRARRGKGEFDQSLLRESLRAYQRASRLNAADTYPKVNEAKVRLLLSAGAPADRETAVAAFHRLENLTRYSIEEIKFDAIRDPHQLSNLPWKLLDLADCLLLSGRGAEGVDTIKMAIGEIPVAQRAPYLSSAIGPWEDFLDTGVLDDDTARFVTEAIRLARTALGT
jgi:tetratricopeptide (TPR) repeat protein